MIPRPPGSALFPIRTLFRSNGPARYLTGVSRVQVKKFVNGAWVTIQDTNLGATSPERLLLSGATQGLTAINIAGVGTRSAIALAGGLYAVDVSDLASGTYSYTTVGTATATSASFEARGGGVTGKPGLQEARA